MLTGAQEIIIRDICSIQSDSLIRILTKVDLETNGNGESYESILHSLGCTRKDFDEQLILTIDNFKRIYDNPELVYSLDELDMLVFKHILHHFKDRWEFKFPKALNNLWNKLFLFQVTNELHNKQ